MSELRVLRERQTDASAALDRADNNQAYGSAAMCCITTTVTTYPTTAGAFYACNPELLTGTEGENLAATFTPDTNTIVYVYNLGAAVIPVGTKIVAHSGSGRLATRYDG